MPKYYKPSGKFSPLAFLYFILIACIALPVLGLAYAYAIWYIPFIYINFIIAAAFGFAISFLITKGVVKFGKVRNVKLTIALSLLAGLIALYFHWAVWVDLAINMGDSVGNYKIGFTISNIKLLQTFNLALNPSVLFEIISEINEYGTWGIRNMTVSGIFLTVIWIIEALIILVMSVVLPLDKVYEPFYELGNEWFEEKTLPAFNYIENNSEMVKNLENSNAEALATLTRTENTEADHSIFSLYSSNHNENYLTVVNKKAKINKKQELEFDDTKFVEYIYLNSELTRVLLAK